ncbi:hypothetical protein [Amycolatopsis saalfeldensis]|nr:hypothetical protein [Amycolatopsis saalfeldensis]
MDAPGDSYPTVDYRDLAPQEVAPADWRDHTMSRERLARYLEIKVHHLVSERDWKCLRVVGRHLPTAESSRYEKRDKLFNWQRPTAVRHGNELVVNCYPGRDYVYHYGLILATYLEMTNRINTRVMVELPEADAARLELSRCTPEIEPGTVVVVGWGLDRIAGVSGWQAGDGYSWKVRHVAGRSVCHLGFEHSIWGDVAGRVVERVYQLGASAVVYVGKVGALNPAWEPNTLLATGDSSLVDGKLVHWRNYFGAGNGARRGVHVTSPSVLLETRTWLEEHIDRQFVDPEIGHMGLAARTCGIPFGYHHIISNNLARNYPADLSNERDGNVRFRRDLLLDQISGEIYNNLPAIKESNDAPR